MSPSDSSTSLSGSLEELDSPQVDRRRRLSGHGSNTYHPDDPRQGQQRSRRNSAGYIEPLQEAEPGLSRGSRPMNVDEQTWADSPPDHTTIHVLDEAWPQTGRISQPNMDRKRRLPNSAHNSGRVRTVGGGFHSRNQSSITSQPEGSSSAGWPHIQRHEPAMHNSSRAGPIERALPALPPIRRNSSDMRGPASTPREIILPKWQPDSEVSECPICSRQFTFWFRKHHCRKCGRVVCAGCSPHRITIPRQFIVHPPESANATSTMAPSNPVVIDLTGEDETSNRPDMPPSWPSLRRLSNPGLGGGEEVRLCNPCVPDPQPSPQATMDLAEFLRQGPGRGEVGTRLEQPAPARSLHRESDQPSLYGQHLPLSEARELRRQRGRGMIFHPAGDNLNTVRTRAGEIPDESLPAYGNFNYTVIPNYSRRDRSPHHHSNLGPTFSPPGYSSLGTSAASVHNRERPRSGPPLPGAVPAHLHRSNSNHLPAHSRYSSMDAMTRVTSSMTSSMSNRPRVRSMLDADPGSRRFMHQVPSSPPSRPFISPRPRLQESDVCPICRHALPSKGADGDETAREAHVMDCIAARDPSAPASTSTRHRATAHSPPSAPIRMLPFAASEKDCVGEDGTTQECSICFVEYDVGDHLARLECLCKFHETCIVEWFGRKQECPVHKVA